MDRKGIQIFLMSILVAVAYDGLLRNIYLRFFLFFYGSSSSFFRSIVLNSGLRSLAASFSKNANNGLY